MVLLEIMIVAFVINRLSDVRLYAAPPMVMEHLDTWQQDDLLAESFCHPFAEIDLFEVHEEAWVQPSQRSVDVASYCKCRPSDALDVLEVHRVGDRIGNGSFRTDRIKK